jgi:hypothetical protein
MDATFTCSIAKRNLCTPSKIYRAFESGLIPDMVSGQSEWSSAVTSYSTLDNSFIAPYPNGSLYL